MDRQPPKYPPVPETDHPDFARRVILELAREDYVYLWELARRVSQLLDMSADKARSLTVHSCAELVVEGSVEVSRTENGVRSTFSEPPALEDSARDVQTGNVSYEASITAHGNEALDETWARNVDAVVTGRTPSKGTRCGSGDDGVRQASIRQCRQSRPLFIFRKQSAGRLRGSCPGEITLGMRESLGHGSR